MVVDYLKRFSILCSIIHTAFELQSAFLYTCTIQYVCSWPYKDCALSEWVGTVL